MVTIGSTLLLLLIAAGLHQFSLRSKFPYTILLFIAGIMLGICNTFLPEGMQLTLHLTPDLLFFVFLPVLIFESGYSMRYYALKRDYLPIWSLATFGLLLSTALITGLGTRLTTMIGLQIPRQVFLIFGVIISATDPVAILAIAKEMGLPKRLRLILEGESLFNDGTALALFLVILELLNHPLDISSGLHGLLLFFQMIIGGIVLGVGIGVGFSYIIRTIKNNEHTEIALTMILAHATFFLAEWISTQSIGGFPLHISGIIATSYAAIILGNFGKTKISPKVEDYMERFRGFFSYVCNSLVFLLMGMMIQTIGLPKQEIWGLIALTMLVVLIARIISIFGTLVPVNLFLAKPIPKSRQFLLGRSGLRGALAVVIVLLIPDTLSFPCWNLVTTPKELIMILVISAILVSLIFQGTTIKHFIRKMNIDALYSLEEFEKYESQILVYHKILDKLNQMKLGYALSEKSFAVLTEKYEDKIEEAKLHLHIFLDQQSSADRLLKKALTLHALGIEKDYLKEMFRYNEIPENLYHYQLSKIELQASRVKSDEEQIRGFNKPLTHQNKSRDPILALIGKLQHTDHCAHDEFILNRTRMILSSKVIIGMKELQAVNFGYNDQRTPGIIERYQAFHDRALAQIITLEAQDEHIAICVESALLNKGLAKTEELVIDELLHKEMITEKLHAMFMEEVEQEVWRRY